MKKNSYFRKITGLFFLGVAILIWGWPQTQEAAVREEINENIIPVITAPVKNTVSHRAVHLSGVTRASKRAVLSFAVPARMVKRNVSVGDRVKKHQTLASLDNRQFRNAIESTQAAVSELNIRMAQAERDRKRMQHLLTAKAASPEEFEKVAAAADAMKAAHAAALSQLKEARRQYSETTLSAPFEGIVTAVRLEPGEWAAPGLPIIELSGDSIIELKVEVPESIISKLQTNQELAVQLPFADGLQVKATIKSVTRATAGPGRLFPVVVELENNSEVGAGMTAELLINIASKEALSVPMKAVINPGSSSPSVFCIRDGKASQIPVKLGQMKNQRITVLGDLTDKDQVVVNGHTMLTNGDLVKVGS